MTNIENIKKEMLKNKYTIIQHAENYFTFTKDDKFGYLEKNKFGEISVSSKYKPSRVNETGAQFKKGFNINLEDIEGALNFTQRGSTGVEFYKDIKDFLVSDFALFENIVITEDKVVPAIKEIEGCYIYTDSRHSLQASASLAELEGLHDRRIGNSDRIIMQMKDGSPTLVKTDMDTLKEEGRKTIAEVYGYVAPKTRNPYVDAILEKANGVDKNKMFEDAATEIECNEPSISAMRP